MNITTILVWLLVSLPSANYKGGAQAGAVIERFQTKEECTRVGEYLTKNSASNSDYSPAPRVGCIQATIVVVPK